MHLDNNKSNDLGRKPPDGNELDHWGRYWPDYWGVNMPKSLLLLLSVVIIEVFCVSLSRPESEVLLLTTMRLTRLMCLHASDTIVISDYACDNHPVILTDASSTSIRRAIIDDSSSCDFDTTLNPQTHHLVDFDERNSHAMLLLSS
jgi:hypothetical protein